jgi:hypothetical protein
MPFPKLREGEAEWKRRLNLAGRLGSPFGSPSLTRVGTSRQLRAQRSAVTAPLTTFCLQIGRFEGAEEGSERAQ